MGIIMHNSKTDVATVYHNKISSQHSRLYMVLLTNPMIADIVAAVRTIGL